MDWRRNLQPGDEIKIDTGDNEIGTSIIIQTIEYIGDTVRILTQDGEKIECLLKDIQ